MTADRDLKNCRGSCQGVRSRQMMAEAWHGMVGAMLRRADGAWSTTLHGPKRADEGAKGLAKGAKRLAKGAKGLGQGGHSASLLCFTNFFK